MYPQLSIAKSKLLRKLQSKKHRDSQNLYIIEGWKMLEEAINDAKLEFVVLKEGFNAKLLKQLQLPKNIEVYLLEDKEFANFSSLNSPQGVLAVCQIGNKQFPTSPDKVVMLNDINDPGNLGSIIRSLDWFGIQGLILAGNCVDPYNSKCLRSSMGSIFRIPIKHTKTAEQEIREFSKQGFKIVSFSSNESSKGDIGKMKNAKVLMIFGSESHGIPSQQEELSDLIYKFPTSSKAESLNLSVSVALACHTLS